MMRLRVGPVSLAVLALVALAAGFGCVANAETTLPLEVAEIFPMSTSELLQLAERGASYAAPEHVVDRHAEEQMQQQDDQQYDEQEQQQQQDESDNALVEHQSEAQVEAAVEAEAEAATSAESQAEAEAQASAEVQAEAEAQMEAEAQAEVENPSEANAAAAIAAAPTPVDPSIPLESATIRLKKHREEILQLEAKIANQTRQMLQNRPPPPVGEAISSGENYWEAGIASLKSSAGIVVKDNANFLTQADARCVICQYVVQQAIGLLAGKPLTTGGATAGGKRAAAAAAAAPPAEEAAAFLEFESLVDEMEEMPLEEDPFAFLELEAGVDAQMTMGVEAVLAAEMESTVALNAALENFLSAADTAMEHSAEQAMRSHYPRPARARRARRAPRGGRGGRGRRARRSRRDFGGRIPTFGRGETPYMGPNLRNVAPVTYPAQLNDFGFETNARNRQADILAYRPRQARFSRAEVKAAQAKWDETRAQYQKLYAGVYQAFEQLCSKRMPLAYSGYCTEMMRDYRYIAQGVQYGDRAASICMNGNWCDRTSYVRHAVHAYFVREAGDN